MGSELLVMNQERDLGARLISSIKTQCKAAVKKTNFMLGVIRKGLRTEYSYSRAPCNLSTFGIPCTVLAATSQNGDYRAGKDAEEGNQNDQRAGVLMRKGCNNWDFLAWKRLNSGT